MDQQQQPQQNNKDHFHGEVITVDVNQPKSLKYKHRKNQFNKHNKNIRHKIDKDALEKHSRGDGMNASGVRMKYFKDKFRRKEVYLEFANEQAARTEILLTEGDGHIEAPEDESTAEYTQEQIVQNVDITAATKHFNLNLDFGPYRMRYTKNGRHLLLAGKMGHVAAFDWITKRLNCEMNVMEECTDVSWLHIETMFAVAQKQWVYIYDNRGTELHCIKRMYNVNKLEFLPYHFLLAGGSSEGYLTWLDISIGEMVAQFNSHLGPIRQMCQNPQNGVLCIGNAKGVVSMWSPSVREPLAKMLCHPSPVSAMAIDPYGTYMATCGVDKTVKIWDIRELRGPLIQYKLRIPANEISISQKGLLAIAMGNVCEVYKKPHILTNHSTRPYLRQRCTDNIHDMRFCAYEDVLGLSTRTGFTSILVPGSGEPNFDAFEANPFQTKSQRRENEVHSLLEKIPMEFIALESDKVTQVDVVTLKEKFDAKKNLMLIKAPKINFEPRKKMKGKGGSVNAAKSKRIVNEMAKKTFVKEIKPIKEKIFNEYTSGSKNTEDDFIPLNVAGAASTKKVNVLDRFNMKKRKQ